MAESEGGDVVVSVAVVFVAVAVAAVVATTVVVVKAVGICSGRGGTSACMYSMFW